MSPSPRQCEFASALRATSRDSVTNFPPHSFAIYRNNRLSTLTEALAATYPATQRILGETFFRTMAREFISAHPPHSPVLLEYGHEFPDFMAAHEPAAALPYLADVARIEWAWMRAYHANDAVSLGADALAALPGDMAEALTFALHPSVTLISSTHPAGTIWQMNADGNVIEPIDAWTPEYILVARPQLSVLVRIFPKDTAAFLRTIGAGLPLVVAAEAGQAVTPDFDLPAQLAGAFALGLITKVTLPD